MKQILSRKCFGIQVMYAGAVYLQWSRYGGYM